jgi:hypothetical protein
MTDDHGASDDSAERQALFRVSFIAAGLIAAGVSLWAWEDKHDARLPQPNSIELGQNG